MTRSPGLAPLSPLSLSLRLTGRGKHTEWLLWTKIVLFQHSKHSSFPTFQILRLNIHVVNLSKVPAWPYSAALQASAIRFPLNLVQKHSHVWPGKVNDVKASGLIRGMNVRSQGSCGENILQVTPAAPGVMGCARVLFPICVPVRTWPRFPASSCPSNRYPQRNRNCQSGEQILLLWHRGTLGWDEAGNNRAPALKHHCERPKNSQSYHLLKKKTTLSYHNHSDWLCWLHLCHFVRLLLPHCPHPESNSKPMPRGYHNLHVS